MSFRQLEELVIGIGNSVLGTSVSYTPITGDPVTINGIFDQAYVESEGVSSLKPVLRIRLSDLDAVPRKGDLVTIESTQYRVIDSQPDGYGGATLILKG